MEELGQVRGGEVMDGFECKEKDFVVDTVSDGEPVELLEDRCNVVGGWRVCDDACSRVLDQLEFMEGFLWETEEEGVAIIQTGGDEAVYEDGSGLGGKRGAETVDVTEMEVGGADGVINVGSEGKGAVKDDTQTLDLRGGGDGRAVNTDGKIVDFG